MSIDLKYQVPTVALHTQMFATFFDGVARHSPEGMWFKQRAEEAGFAEAVKERDGGANIAEGVSRKSSSN